MRPHLAFHNFWAEFGPPIGMAIIDFTCGQSHRAPLWSKQRGTPESRNAERWLATPSRAAEGC